MNAENYDCTYIWLILVPRIIRMQKDMVQEQNVKTFRKEFAKSRSGNKEFNQTRIKMILIASIS